MVWPEQMILAVVGRRVDELSLAWAAGLASRWQSRLHVIAGYQPPVGMFPHIVTARELRAARRRVREEMERQISEAVLGLDPPVETRLTIVTHNQLEHAITTHAGRAGLVLFGIAPTGLLVRRRRARAARLAVGLPCPVSLGPGQAVEPIGPDPVPPAHTGTVGP